MKRGRSVRVVATGIGLLLFATGLAYVSVPVGSLPPGVPHTWWWSDALPLLTGAALPALVAICAVIASRRVVASLLLGTLTAAVLVAGPHPVAIARAFVVDYLWAALADPFHLAILGFTVLLLGLVRVTIVSGGAAGLVGLIRRFARGRRGTRVSTALMGLVVFFDDYTNTAVVGPTMRPLFDGLRLPREKLAYIIDSTAAPVAGLALVSTWVGAEVGYMQDAAATLGVHTGGYALFLGALGFRFYCVFALALVLLIAATGRDFGPMLDAERRAAATGQVARPGARVVDPQDLPPNVTPQWSFAVVPISLVVVTILVAVYVGGGQDAGSVHSPSAWRDAFITAGRRADGNYVGYAFVAAAAVGVLASVALPRVRGALDLADGIAAWHAGARSVLVPLVVLVCAWALAKGSQQLHSAGYVGAALGDVEARFVPLVVFFVAAAVAFATGSSWSTMAILIPTAAAIAFPGGGEPLMVVAMAAVLDGAIFGDHCSPLSDTTVLSSACSACDHIDHVKTQAPYALVGAAVAAVAGYGLVGTGLAPRSVGYLVGGIALVLIVFAVGRRSDPD